MKSGTIFITIGVLLELINIYSLMNVPYDTNKGTDYLIGEILFNVFLGVAGITFIIVGILNQKNEKRNQSR